MPENHVAGLGGVPLPWGIELLSRLQRLQRGQEVAPAALGAGPSSCRGMACHPVPAGPAPCCKCSQSCRHSSLARQGSHWSHCAVLSTAAPARPAGPSVCMCTSWPAPPWHGCLRDHSVTTKVAERGHGGAGGVPYPLRGGHRASAPAWPGPQMPHGSLLPWPGTGPGRPG